MILIFSVLIISALCFLVMNLNQEKGTCAEITVGGEVYGIYPLEIDKKITICLDCEDKSQYNILVIENGKADMIEATCPDGVCVDHAPISNVGETIVCLPQKVVVTIVGSGSEVDVTV